VFLLLLSRQFVVLVRFVFHYLSVSRQHQWNRYYPLIYLVLDLLDLRFSAAPDCGTPDQTYPQHQEPYSQRHTLYIVQVDQHVRLRRLGRENREKESGRQQERRGRKGEAHQPPHAHRECRLVYVAQGHQSQDEPHAGVGVASAPESCLSSFWVYAGSPMRSERMLAPPNSTVSSGISRMPATWRDWNSCRSFPVLTLGALCFSLLGWAVGSSTGPSRYTFRWSSLLPPDDCSQARSCPTSFGGSLIEDHRIIPMQKSFIAARSNNGAGPSENTLNRRPPPCRRKLRNKK
jgi:hypothetical protein